jgi:hypothetical protein
MGDHAGLAAGQSLPLRIRVTGLAGGRIVLVHDAGLSVDPDPVEPLAADDTRTARVTADGGRHWLYVKIDDAAGRLALVGNPLYFDKAD